MKEITFSDYHTIIAVELRAALQRYFKTWEKVRAQKPEEQQLWVAVIEAPRLTVVLLICSLLESSINFYLSTKHNSGRFKSLERSSLETKWKDLPKEFAQTYSLPAKSDLHRDLSNLIKRRNAVVHSKPFMNIDGDLRHTGNMPVINLDEHEFIARSATLPLRLIEHLLEHDPEAMVPLISLHTCCAGPAVLFKKCEYRLENGKKTAGPRQ